MIKFCLFVCVWRSEKTKNRKRKIAPILQNTEITGFGVWEGSVEDLLSSWILHSRLSNWLSCVLGGLQRLQCRSGGKCRALH